MISFFFSALTIKVKLKQILFFLIISSLVTVNYNNNLYLLPMTNSNPI